MSHEAPRARRYAQAGNGLVEKTISHIQDLFSLFDES